MEINLGVTTSRMRARSSVEHNRSRADGSVQARVIASGLATIMPALSLAHHFVVVGACLLALLGACGSRTQTGQGRSSRPVQDGHSRHGRGFLDPSTRPKDSAVEEIISDMNAPHEGQPHGVPRHYAWALKPRIDRGNNASGYAAITAWGQLYEDATGNPATNTRVEIWGFRSYVLSKSDGLWHLLQEGSNINGGSFREDFQNNEVRPGDLRRLKAGRITATAGNGFNFHFWPRDRAPIDPSDVAGIFVTLQARLVLNDPNGLDDRDSARYLLSVGGDYWRDRHIAWNPHGANTGIGLGRFKYVRSFPRRFNMTTLTADELRANPPPLAP